MRLARAFKYAFSGLKILMRERNMRIHVCATFYVLVAAAVTGCSRIEWAALLICVSLVMGAECINTSIEELCDAVSPEKSDAIGRVKDLAAGAVLIFAVFSAVTGCVIFFEGEKIYRLAGFAMNHPVMAALLALCLPAWIFLNTYLEKRI